MTLIILNQKKKNKKRINVLIYAAIIAVVFTALLVCFCFQPKKDTVPVVVPEPEPSAPTIELVDPTYITETCFDGIKELNPYLFHFPFKKTNYYLCNKDLVIKTDPKVIEKLQADAISFIEIFYPANSDEIIYSYDKEYLKFNKFFIPDSEYIDLKDNYHSTKQYVDEAVKIIAEADFQTRVTFETDKSLVWKDNAYFVRGYLKIEVFEGSSSEELSLLYPFELCGNKNIHAIVDIGFIPGIDNYQVTSVDYMWIEQEERTYSDSKWWLNMSQVKD